MHIAAVICGLWIAIFVVSLCLGELAAGNARASGDELAGPSVITYTFDGAIAWIPLAIVSLVLAIVALGRRERDRGWAMHSSAQRCSGSINLLLLRLCILDELISRYRPCTHGH
jgi:hypothetical protein